MFKKGGSNRPLSRRRRNDSCQFITYLDMNVTNWNQTTKDQLDLLSIQYRPARLICLLNVVFEYLST